MVTGSVDLGTGGKCFTSKINGAALFVAVEFVPPGVPCDLALATQFCPELFGSFGLLMTRPFEFLLARRYLAVRTRLSCRKTQRAKATKSC